LHHRDPDGDHARFVGVLRFDEINPFTRIIEGRGARGRRFINARRD
jgi:hypothetical protein